MNVWAIFPPVIGSALGVLLGALIVRWLDQR